MKYEDSGVDIDKANKIKREIAKHVSSTWSEGVLSKVGHFGGLYRLNEVRNPVLVSSIDGVGTKMIVAEMAGDFTTVGKDLVNHCVNDILVQGAVPLFFLDYMAAAALDARKVEELIKGMAEACRENGCALIAGETAEMPGVYREGAVDVAGCIVGLVEEERIIDGSTTVAGDEIYALPSSGLHTNGYSLARKIFFDVLGHAIDDDIDELGCSVRDELLKVHRSYLREMTTLMTNIPIRGMAHITGGGIPGNLKRILPRNCTARIHRDSWRVPPVFEFMRAAGDVDDGEMYRTFNMGLGMIFVVPPGCGSKISGLVADAFKIGEIVKGEGEVMIV